MTFQINNESPKNETQLSALFRSSPFSRPTILSSLFLRIETTNLIGAINGTGPVDPSGHKGRLAVQDGCSWKGNGSN